METRTKVLVVVLCVVLALVGAALVARRRRRARLGGAVPAPTVARWKKRAAERHAAERESDNLVVDTLNLVYSVTGSGPSLCTILETIEATAPQLRRRYPGRLVYVLKGRSSEAAVPAATRNAYQAAAKRNGVHINLVEKSPVAKEGPTGSHAALGRDDFYLVMLARKYRCPVLTRDRFRDLSEMKTDLPPFYVRAWDATGRETRDFVTPTAPELRRLPRPTRVDPSEALRP